MDQPIYQPVKTNPRFILLLKEAANFLKNPDNINQKWYGWTYQEALFFLKNFLQESYPHQDLENVTLETLIDYLDQLLGEEHLESRIPQNLQQLLEELEKSKNEAKIYQQKAAAKILAYQEALQVRREFLKRQRVFQEVSEKYAAKVKERLSQEEVSDKENLAQKITDSIPPQTDLKLNLEKAANLPPPEKIATEEQVINDYGNLMRVAASQLKENKQISEKEEKSLKKIQASLPDLSFLLRELEQPPPQRPETIKWFYEQLSPVLTLTEAEKITSLVTPALVNNFPEINLPLRQIEEITAEKFQEIRTEIEKAVILSLAQVAPEIGEIPPEKISRIISAFLPQNQDELKQDFNFWSQPPTPIIPPKTLAEPEIINVTQLPSKTPLIFSRGWKRASQGKVSRIKNENGLDLVQQLREQIFREGINQQNANLLRSKIIENWVLWLTTRAISPEDIEKTSESLVKKGENPNSPIIKELREIQITLREFLKKLPLKEARQIRKIILTEGLRGAYPLQLPSRFGTIIIRKTAYQPKFNLWTRINTFSERILGKKIIALGPSELVSLGKLPLLKHQIAENLKIRFFQTAFGQSLRLSLEKASQKSLQVLWTTATTGIKQVAVKGIISFLAKIGLQALATTIAPLIGNIIAFVGGHLIRGGLSLIKKGFGWLSSGFGLGNIVLQGITGETYIEEDTTLKPLKWIFIAIFVFLFFGVFFNMTTIAGTFIDNKELGEQVPAGGCFVFTGLWSTEEKSLVNSAINRILEHPQYTNALCQNNEIIYLLREISGESCRVDGSKIHLIDRCLGNEENSLYSLTHETGHIYSGRNSLVFKRYLTEIGSVNGPLEKFLCSYPAELGRTYSEDFAETFAVYITNYHYPDHTYRHCDGQKIDLPKDYPLHYNFIKDLI